MLNRIIKYSLDNRLFVLLLALLILLGGIYSIRKIEVDVFPDLTAPTVVILTDAHGMAVEEVEKLVALPIESAMNGATGVRRVRSSSSFGMAIVWVEFDWGTDIYKARQIVSEKLPTINTQLPEGIDPPILAPQTSIMGEIMLIGVTSDSLSAYELRTLSDRTIKQRLLSVTGVSQVVVMGGLTTQYQILLDPYKMRYFKITLEEIHQATDNTNSTTSGGLINEAGQEYIIRTTGRSTRLEDIANTVIKVQEERPVKISDIGTVRIGHPTPIGDAFLNQEPAVVMTVLKQPNTNTLKLTGDIDQVLAELSRTLSPGTEINTEILRQASFITIAVRNVLKVLIEGGIFVSFILFLFLLNGRTTFISLVAIPLSLMLSILIIRLLGLSINTMSLGGMAIAIGALVDDAIIDVENVLKRLKQNHQLPPDERKPTLSIIYDASVEIRSSIVQATLIIIVAFIPLFFLSGMEGRMLKPLGITFIVSLFASLVVALSVTPVLASYLLTNQKQLITHIRGRNRLVQHLNRAYEKWLRWILSVRKGVVIVTTVLLIISVFLLSRFGRSFLPEFNEGTLTLTTSTFPGISLEESSKLTGLIDQKLMEIPEVVHVSRRTGRAELNEHSHGGTNSSEIDVPYTLKERDQAEFMEEVRYKLSTIPGININIGQPLGHRIDHMLSGTRASIAIKIFGSDLVRLYGMANEIKGAISDIDGLVDLNVEQLVEIPQIQIRPRREMLARYGIPQNQLIHFVETAISGAKVSEVYEENISFDLIIRYDQPFRNNLDAIRNTLIDTYSGQKIPLSYVCDVVSTSGPNTINRENVRRKLVVSANVAGRDVGSAVKEIRASIEEKITIPENYFIQFGGQFESATRASKTLFLMSLLAILVIFMILLQEFKSPRLAAIILLNLPLALIGGVFAIWLSSGTLSIPAIIGFITLFGIATRNGILLVSRYQHLEYNGGSIIETIIQGSVDRLNPILMTALASALALLPLALSGGEPGNEIQSPMAKVILGGLITSTLLNLIVIPVVYYITHKTKEHETEV